MQEQIDLARVLAREGKYEEAITKLKSLFEHASDPDDPSRIHAALGHGYNRMGDVERALGEMDKAIEVLPRSRLMFLREAVIS